DYVLTVAHDPDKKPQEKLQEIRAQIMEYTCTALAGSDDEEIVRENADDEVLCVIWEGEKQTSQYFILDAKNNRSANLTLMGENYLSIKDRPLSPESVESFWEFYTLR